MSIVATEQPAVTDEAVTPRGWTRTDDQQLTVSAYDAEIDTMYAGASPELLAALKDTTVLGTDDLVDLFGYKRRTRVYQLYSDLRELAAADQTPHPSAMPDLDAVGGHRGAGEIRGVMKGRVIHWGLQSGRFWWDQQTKTIRRQEAINHGGAPRRS